MFALVLTGPTGAGKSTTLEALTDALHDDDVRHASIEIEAVSSAHPGLGVAQRLRHVQAISALYKDEGYELLLVAAPVGTTAELEALLVALGADDHFLVRLNALQATLQSRIVDREPPGWSQLDRLLNRTRGLKAAMDAEGLGDLVIDTDGLTRMQVVDRVRKGCSRLA